MRDKTDNHQQIKPIHISKYVFCSNVPALVMSV